MSRHTIQVRTGTDAGHQTRYNAVPSQYGYVLTSNPQSADGLTWEKPKHAPIVQPTQSGSLAPSTSRRGSVDPTGIDQSIDNKIKQSEQKLMAEIAKPRAADTTATEERLTKHVDELVSKIPPPVAIMQTNKI